MADASLQRSRQALIRAARPFSLVVAVASCGLGIHLGLRGADPAWGWTWSVVAVMLAGIVLQLGVNLINDHSDLALLRDDDPSTPERRRQIQLAYKLGLLCFGLATAIGLALVVMRGWTLLAICLIGLIGAFAYTTEPINYKRRGLGVLLVFWLMGVLMIVGAAIAAGGEPAWSGFRHLFWHSLPLSALVSLLLLGNEIRDIEADAANGVRTLSTRIGLSRARLLFWALILLAYLLSAVSASQGWLRSPLWLVLPLPLLLPMARHLMAPERRPLPPWSGRFLLLFAIGYGLAL